jgi:hypothetical protein
LITLATLNACLHASLPADSDPGSFGRTGSQCMPIRERFGQLMLEVGRAPYDTIDDCQKQICHELLDQFTN